MTNSSIITLKSNLSSAQISKNKQTNPSAYLHSEVHLPEKPQAPEPPADPADSPLFKKFLLIRVNVEKGRVVSESSHYSEG